MAEPFGRVRTKRNTIPPKSGSRMQIGFGGAEQKIAGRPKEHYQNCMKSKDFGLDFAVTERYTYTKKYPRRAKCPQKRLEVLIE